MRVALLTSEAMPFAKTGGLADVSGALPKALQEQGVDAKLILPLYDQIDRRQLNDKIIEGIRVEWRGQVHHIRALQSDVAEAPAYLIQAPEFFARPNIYGYSDDHIRFAFFSRAALALLKHLNWQPDIVHGRLVLLFTLGTLDTSKRLRQGASLGKEGLRHRSQIPNGSNQTPAQSSGFTGLVEWE